MANRKPPDWPRQALRSALLACFCARAIVIFVLPAAAQGSSSLQADSRTIKVEVALVTVPVTVADKEGNYIPGLQITDFHIFENGAQQRIDRMIPAEEPFSVVLMLDSSGSTHFKFADIQDAARAFVETLRPQDRVMIVSFDDELRIHCGFTDDRARLREAILQTRSSQEGTRLHDALNSVIETRLAPLTGRKAIVLFSDGVDNGSVAADSGDTKSRIEKSDVVLYAIQYDTRKDGVSDWFSVPLPQGYVSFDTLYSRAVKYFGSLTVRSGGRLFHAETVAALNDAFSRIAEEMPRQYTLCYYPASQAKDGTFRSIRVTVDRPGAKVRARAGYRAGTNPAKSR